MKETSYELEVAVQFRNKLISFLSHEIKGLYANIFWMIEMMEQNDGSQELITELRKIASKNFDSVSETIRWIKAQDNYFHPNLQSINLYELFTETGQFFSPQLKEKNKQFKFDGDKQLNIVSDKVVIQFVFKQLMDAFVQQNSSKIIYVECSADANILYVTVKTNADEDKTINQTPSSIYQSFDPTNIQSEHLNFHYLKDFLTLVKGNISIGEADNKLLQITLSLPLDL